MSEERGWVIEHERNGRLVYYAGGYKSFAWSDDSLRAIRFAREVDAARVRKFLLFVGTPENPPSQPRVSEHIWTGAQFADEALAQFSRAMRESADDPQACAIQVDLARQGEQDSDRYARELIEALKQIYAERGEDEFIRNICRSVLP